MTGVRRLTLTLALYGVTACGSSGEDGTQATPVGSPNAPSINPNKGAPNSDASAADSNSVSTPISSNANGGTVGVANSNTNVQNSPPPSPTYYLSWGNTFSALDDLSDLSQANTKIAFICYPPSSAFVVKLNDTPVVSGVVLASGQCDVPYNDTIRDPTFKQSLSALNHISVHLDQNVTATSSFDFTYMSHDWMVELDRTAGGPFVSDSYVAWQSSVSGTPNVYTKSLADGSVLNQTSDTYQISAWGLTGSHLVFANNTTGAALSADIYSKDLSSGATSLLASQSDFNNVYVGWSINYRGQVYLYGSSFLYSEIERMPPGPGSATQCTIYAQNLTGTGHQALDQVAYANASMDGLWCLQDAAGSYVLLSLSNPGSRKNLFLKYLGSNNLQQLTDASANKTIGGGATDGNWVVWSEINSLGDVNVYSYNILAQATQEIADPNVVVFGSGTDMVDLKDGKLFVPVNNYSRKPSGLYIYDLQEKSGAYVQVTASGGPRWGCDTRGNKIFCIIQDGRSFWLTQQTLSLQ